MPAPCSQQLSSSLQGCPRVLPEGLGVSTEAKHRRENHEFLWSVGCSRNCAVERGILPAPGPPPVPGWPLWAGWGRHWPKTHLTKKTHCQVFPPWRQRWGAGLCRGEQLCNINPVLPGQAPAAFCPFPMWSISSPWGLISV